MSISNELNRFEQTAARISPLDRKIRICKRIQVISSLVIAILIILFIISINGIRNKTMIAVAGTALILLGNLYGFLYIRSLRRAIVNIHLQLYQSL